MALCRSRMAGTLSGKLLKTPTLLQKASSPAQCISSQFQLSSFLGKSISQCTSERSKSLLLPQQSFQSTISPSFVILDKSFVRHVEPSDQLHDISLPTTSSQFYDSMYCYKDREKDGRGSYKWWSPPKSRSFRTRQVFRYIREGRPTPHFKFRVKPNQAKRLPAKVKKS